MRLLFEGFGGWERMGKGDRGWKRGSPGSVGLERGKTFTFAA